MKKRGQMKISFGMIFSIILIVAFLAFGFYAIKIFLDMQKDSKVANFMTSFQDDVDKAWKSPKTNQPVSYELPSNIEKVCLKIPKYTADSNLMFIPEESVTLSIPIINNIDMEKTTRRENLRSVDPDGAFCVDNKDEKVEMVLVKGTGDRLVTVNRI